MDHESVFIGSRFSFGLGSIFVHPQLRASFVCSVCSACMCCLHGLKGAGRGCRRSFLKLKIAKREE